jgi:MarR family transcriptional regulator, transcriptional regulator for hemolysin
MPLDRPPEIPFHTVKMTDDLLTRLTSVAADARSDFRRQMAAEGFAWHLNASGEVLSHIPKEGLSQSALTARLGLSKQAVQQLLDQLEGLGVIRRETDASDRRARQIVLTELGLRDLATQRQVREHLEAAARDKLGKKLLGKFEKALKRLGN